MFVTHKEVLGIRALSCRILQRSEKNTFQRIKNREYVKGENYKNMLGYLKRVS
jgi:hypothetical protein